MVKRQLDLDSLKKTVENSNSETEEELAKRGEITEEKASKLQLGSVLIVTDTGAVGFPENKLPSSGERTSHSGRYVILVQANNYNRARTFRTMLVVPCSASVEVAMPWDYQIPPTEKAFSKPNVVALCRLVQPILKIDFQKRAGVLSPETLGELQAKLASIMHR
jgi:mRNA-degrading endonuclease toxin of MazEF toxin-antitoxin module